MARNYINELAALTASKEAILADLAFERSNKKFKCVCCDKMHTIRKCDAFTFPTWESGSGYDDGRWYEGELYVLCPTTGRYNRCYFNSPQYPHYNSYDHSAGMQFKSIYKSLFKSVTLGDDNKKLDYHLWDNNHYFDQHHDKFDLKVKKS